MSYEVIKEMGRERAGGEEITAQNRMAVQTTANKYANALKQARKTFNIQRIGEAVNRQAELFWVARDLSSSGHSGPHLEFTSDQCAAFFRTRMDAIRADLDSTSSLADPGSDHCCSISHCPVSSV